MFFHNTYKQVGTHHYYNIQIDKYLSLHLICMSQLIIATALKLYILNINISIGYIHGVAIFFYSLAIYFLKVPSFLYVGYNSSTMFYKL